jgi:DNA modification methylase
MIGPYKCCSVVQGDCLELMKQLSDRLVCECGADVTGEGGLFHCLAGHQNRAVKLVDLILTDPPYGIGMSAGFGGSRAFGGGSGKKIEARAYPDTWDKSRPNEQYFSLMLRISDLVIIFGGNYFADILPQSKHWIVWDKCQTMPTFSDCELAWTNSDRKSVKKYTVEWNGLLGKEAERFHPTQKPEQLMAEILSDYPGDTILDPFSGSGTTLVAAKKLGRHFLGFEISPEYCEIARDRLARIDAQPSLFEPKPEQLSLNGGDDRG